MLFLSGSVTLMDTDFIGAKKSSKWIECAMENFDF